MSTTHTTDSIGELTGPLIPASAIPEWYHPAKTLPGRVSQSLEINGQKRAVDSRGTSKRHVRGIKGEYVVGDLFGRPDSIDTEIYDYGDPGYDLELWGNRIDVKTANPRANNPSLMVDAEQELTADYYVLVQELNPSTYRVIGYAPRETVVQARTRPVPRCDYADQIYPTANKVRVVEQDEIFPITTFCGRIPHR